jgi:outer membrane protein
MNLNIMRILIVWNAFLSLALLWLLFNTYPKGNSADLQDPTDTDTTKSETDLRPLSTGISNAEAPIAFVNTDSLFKQLNMYKDMEEELIADRMKAENRYRGEAQKLEKDYNNLRDKAPYMTQAQGEIEQAKLMAKRDELLKIEEDLSTKLAEKESGALQKIKTTLEEYLERYNRDKGYHYILGKSQIGGILYAQKALDITPEIIAGLNAEYEASKAKK